MAPPRTIEATLQTLTKQLIVDVQADAVVHQVVKDKLDASGNIAIRHLPDSWVVKHGDTFQDVAVTDQVVLAVVVIAAVQCTPEYLRPKLEAFLRRHGVTLAALLEESHYRDYRFFHAWEDDEEDDCEGVTFFELRRALHLPIPAPKEVHLCVNQQYGCHMSLCVARYDRAVAMAALDDILCLLLLHGMKQQHLYLLRGVDGSLKADALLERLDGASMDPFMEHDQVEQPMQFLKQVPLANMNIVRHYPWTSRGGGKWSSRPPSDAPGGAEWVWMMVDYTVPGGAQWCAAYACGDSEFWLYLSEIRNFWEMGY